VFYAGGAGFCLVEEASGRTVTHAAHTFDRQFVTRHRIALRGIPVRVRVSPDGRLGAITTYGEEESPEGERLATETVVIEMASGRVLGDLREFAVDTAGHAIKGPVDIASVTFEADSDRFYATLSAGSTRYLVRGSVGARRLAVVRPGIANEALSPDGTKLIAKQLADARGVWRISVVDLRTWSERMLNQGDRSVDDQVDWFDDRHVMYHDVTERGTGIWKLPIDGIGWPELLLPDAFSPSVQR
jgi:hypothetical protein